MIDCVLISSEETFRHAVMGIVGKPANKTRLSLDLKMFAEGLNRDTLGKVLKAKPRVVFLDLGPDPTGIGAVQTLNQEAPDAALVVGGPALSAEGLLAVMRAGATEYLPRPFSVEETAEAFSRVKRRARTKGSDKPETLGRVTTVFSAKGGTGVTTVATNLAVALRLLTERKVLMLDLTPGMGTAAVAMGVQPRYTYVDVIKNFHRIDEELLDSFLEADESGVRIMASPLSPVGADAPSGGELQDLATLCRQYFDYVVIDAGSFLSGDLRPLLDVTDHRLLVVTPELPTLRNLKFALDLYGRSNGREPPQLVLNQYKEGLGLSSRDVEDGLGHRLALVLGRDDMRVLQSINLGRPEVLVGKSRFAKEVMALARKLAGPDAASEPRQGILARFFPSGKGADSTRKEARE